MKQAVDVSPIESGQDVLAHVNPIVVWYSNDLAFLMLHKSSRYSNQVILSILILLLGHRRQKATLPMQKGGVLYYHWSQWCSFYSERSQLITGAIHWYFRRRYPSHLYGIKVHRKTHQRGWSAWKMSDSNPSLCDHRSNNTGYVTKRYRRQDQGKVSAWPVVPTVFFGAARPILMRWRHWQPCRAHLSGGSLGRCSGRWVVRGRCPSGAGW